MLQPDDGRKLQYLHPWLYHVVWKADDRSRETVASDGLAPGVPRHKWHPLFTSRPGHVYLCTMAYMRKVAWWVRSPGDDVYAVRTSALLAARVNPDEDHFSGECEAACDRLNLVRPGGLALHKMFPSAVPSFGEWAEQIDLGSDPAHTRYSLDHGSIAYNGVVPPTALRRWDGKRYVAA